MRSVWMLLWIGSASMVTQSGSAALRSELGVKEAFEALKRELRKSYKGAKTHSTAQDRCEWILSAQTYKDTPTPGVRAQSPQILSGSELLGRALETRVGTQVIFGGFKSIDTHQRYWVFSWHQPGVIDHECTFILDAVEGTLRVALVYSSPD